MNEPILVDTSVWVNYWTNNKTRSVELLCYLMPEHNKVWLCPTIIQETLQGFKTTDQFDKYQRLFNGFAHVQCLHYHAHTEAAKMYMTLRKKGITIQKPNDCLIAFYAMENDLVLAHDDLDFEQIKKEYPLRTYH